MKKYLNKSNIKSYLLEQLTGNFAGFLIGTSATGLLSHFFETRSIRNLWGFAAHKKVLDKETFSNLEWLLSILIGFLVFEIMTKVVKEKIIKYYPQYKIKLLRWLISAIPLIKVFKFKIITKVNTFKKFTQTQF